MRTLVLDGFNESSALQESAVNTVVTELSGRGFQSEVLTPREMSLSPCTGCFGCWTRRPGRCVQDDDADALARKIMSSGLFVILSPITFGGYSSSVKKALDRAQLTINDIDIIELNEAFASQAIACMKELKMDEEKTNPLGSGISLGHPIGCTGARLLVTIAHEMKRKNQKHGLITMCIGGGQGMAMIVER